SAVAVIGNRVLLIRDDLPEPETPVTQVNRPTGISRSTFFSLLPQAPLSRSHLSLLGGMRLLGTWIFFSPDRYWPDREVESAMTCSGVPWETIRPPWTPAPGPMSTT